MTVDLYDAHAGRGNWAAFPPNKVDCIFEAAEDWRRALAGVDRPWLCWCVDDEWCILQQRLVTACGWTPIVGTDGRIPTPTVIKSALFVDFNASLNLPVMWMHFPLEFVFRFCNRLAFWHSDVLPPLSVMLQIAAQFELIRPGEVIAVPDFPGMRRRLNRLWRGIKQRSWRRLKNINAKRWFEVVGCTTREASASQYDSGCGFWRCIDKHPNVRDRIRDMSPYYDHGVGLWYWQQYFGGKTRPLAVDVERHHYVTKRTTRSSPRDRVHTKGTALRQVYTLRDIASVLELD